MEDTQKRFLFLYQGWRHACPNEVVKNVADHGWATKFFQI